MLEGPQWMSRSEELDTRPKRPSSKQCRGSPEPSALQGPDWMSRSDELDARPKRPSSKQRRGSPEPSSLAPLQEPEWMSRSDELDARPTGPASRRRGSPEPSSMEDVGMRPASSASKTKRSISKSKSATSKQREANEGLERQASPDACSSKVPDWMTQSDNLDTRPHRGGSTAASKRPRSPEPRPLGAPSWMSESGDLDARPKRATSKSKKPIASNRLGSPEPSPLEAPAWMSQSESLDVRPRRTASKEPIARSPEPRSKEPIARSPEPRSLAAPQWMSQSEDLDGRPKRATSKSKKPISTKRVKSPEPAPLEVPVWMSQSESLHDRPKRATSTEPMASKRPGSPEYRASAAPKWMSQSEDLDARPPRATSKGSKAPGSKRLGSPEPSPLEGPEWLSQSEDLSSRPKRATSKSKKMTASKRQGSPEPSPLDAPKWMSQSENLDVRPRKRSTSRPGRRSISRSVERNGDLKQSVNTTPSKQAVKDPATPPKVLPSSRGAGRLQNLKELKPPPPPRGTADGSAAWLSQNGWLPTVRVTHDDDDPWASPPLTPTGRDKVVDALHMPTVAGGLMPTTRHILPWAVAAPPLASAWVPSRERAGWYCSRTSESWVFKADEGVLFHSDTSTLWTLDTGATGGGFPVTRRADLVWRSALLGFAEIADMVILRLCVMQWHEIATSVGRQQSHIAPSIRKMCSCTICLDFFLLCNDNRGAPVGGGALLLQECGHVLCTECLGSYAISAANLRQWGTDGLRCPVPGCSTRMPGETVLSIASMAAEQREVLARHLCRLLLVGAWCCPNPDCGAVYEGDMEEAKAACPQTFCRECGDSLCLACRCAWHEGLTCAEYQRRLSAEDVPLMQLAEELGWRRCSNCGTMVERLDGCNHIECSTCGHHFCYRCGGPFDRERLRCLDSHCGLYQARTARAIQPESLGVFSFVRDAFRRARPVPLTDERRGFLRQWARTSRPQVDLSLLDSGAIMWAVLPEWQRSMLREFRCPYCRVRGSSLASLEMHLREMCRQDVWTCCGRLFSSADEMEIHISDRHPDLNGRERW
eukprot:gnl/TRDRNA2_/TRDRNA2_152052_c0_seq1.p1 gnl/TRDRNA2_/TRDRNA2_152052_c0~~gnl/TRDRNA2_/TRDRNA2_152052_c0_seq1.p1  ORF type:complete len:1121 (-),score=133.60 gnl/TRDRNA2_/TRDRNA2_152052_c0_seq1:131-3274(-)